MPLDIGTRLGRYEIRELLGAGGMGEVWRARDSVLDRDVALKLLAPELATDADRVGRFRREARVLAQLEHPAIATIHGFEEVDGQLLLVMRLVAGQDLEERLRGGAMPVEQAVEVFRQIAEGLEAAHERGIVHRDLKPANIKIDPDGRVQILDFGLAKVLEPDRGKSVDLSAAPTWDAGVGATHVGAILGTAPYMAPEQARGLAADAGADVWAFGVVLWEALVGDRLFHGESLGETLAAVLSQEIDFAKLPSETPPSVRWILERCLVRDPRGRLRGIGEARILFENPTLAPRTFPRTGSGEAAPGEAGTVEDTPASARNRGAARRWRGVAFALALLTGALVAAWFFLDSGRAAPEVSFVTLPLATETQLATSGIQPGPPAVSPDGRQVAYVAEDPAGRRLLWVRDLAAAEPVAIAGSEGASYPFWSPDGEQIGFFAQAKLLRVPAIGGIVLQIADVDTPKGGAWSRDGVILLNPGFDQPLFTVPATGGIPLPLTELNSDRGEISHRFPQFLENGRQFLFLVRKSNDSENETVLASLDDPDSRTVVVRSPTNALAVGDAILFRRGEALLAQRFDPSTGGLSGEPRVLVESVATISGAARMLVAAGPGALVYQAPGFAETLELVLVDRRGEILRRLSDVGSDNPALSPDGRTLAVQGQSPEDGTQDILLIDVATGNREAFTFEPGHKIRPIWSPDGRRIAYSSNTRGPYEIFAKPFGRRGAAAGGDEDPVRLVANEDTELRVIPQAWSRDAESGAEYFVYSMARLNEPRHEIWFVRLDDEEPPRRITETTGTSAGARLSPDTKWLAYRSGVDVRDPRIFVTDFPGAGRRWEVARGWTCDWVASGVEMICLDLDLDLLALPVAAREGTFAWGSPSELFRLRERWFTGDGDRFVVRRPATLLTGSTGRLELVLGWEALTADL